MVLGGFLYLPLAKKWRSTKQQTSFRASSGKKSNDLPSAFISIWVTTDVRTVAIMFPLLPFQTFLPLSSLQRQTAARLRPPTLLTPLLHPPTLSPPSIPLCLHPITLCCSLILPHLLSLDSGVTFSPGHEFYMIVHLCIWKEKKKPKLKPLSFLLRSHKDSSGPFPSLKCYVKWMFQWDLFTGSSSRVPRIWLAGGQIYTV